MTQALSLDVWIARQTGLSARAIMAAISATDLVKTRTGFGQTVKPRAGSVLASIVPASYDPDPDYFFHWFRDAAITVDALRIAYEDGHIGRDALARFAEFIDFSLSALKLDGKAFLETPDFRQRVQPFFLQYLRPDHEIADVSAATASLETRVNADGTLDFIKWPRPQADGPAMRLLTLLRWWRHISDPALRERAALLMRHDIDTTLAQCRAPSFDIWEEESGHHYYTRAIQAQSLQEALNQSEVRLPSAVIQHCEAALVGIERFLDSLWNAEAGFYHSRVTVEPGVASKKLDVSVILAVIHMSRGGGAHSVLDPRAQATLALLEELFESSYVINRSRANDQGIAMGRYAEDQYYSGGAYFFATLAAAEFHYGLAERLFAGAALVKTKDNRRFLDRLRDHEEGDARGIAGAALRKGDAFMEVVRAFTPEAGDLSEQFDQTSGAQTSAKHLTWSHAAFLTAASRRSRICPRDPRPA